MRYIKTSKELNGKWNIALINKIMKYWKYFFYNFDFKKKKKNF